MKTVNVDKNALLEVMRANRDKHRQVFLDALEGYRAHALAVLEEQVTALRHGKVPDLRIVIGRPEDHTSDYNRAIKMVEMDLSATFELNEQDFAQYVDDDWHWKGQWLKTSNTYAAASTQKAYGLSE